MKGEPDRQPEDALTGEDDEQSREMLDDAERAWHHQIEQEEASAGHQIEAGYWLRLILIGVAVFGLLFLVLSG